MRDFTLPRYALIRGQRFRSMLHRTFGTRLIEELPRGFCCGSGPRRTRAGACLSGWRSMR